MDWISDRLGLRTNPPVFYTSAVLTIVFVLLSTVFAAQIGTFFGTVTEQVLRSFGWFYVLTITAFVLFLIGVAASRYGRIRLGSDHDQPVYSNPVWFGMLFAAGIGTILMFFGIAEPLSHFAEPPPMDPVEPMTAAAAEQAMSFTLYHYGIHTWAIFGLPALGFAFFAYRRGLPMRVSSVLHPLLGDRIYGAPGKIVDTIAVLGTLFGVATSLGLGTLQINSGLNYVLGVGENLPIQLIIITVITIMATASVASGLDRGIKLLSNINIVVAVALLIFVIATGPTILILNGIVESTGNYLTNLPRIAFFTETMSDSDWQNTWTTFYFAWTITWSPFVGLFIARISKGRTIRQFILGVLLAPTVFTIFWFSTFGFAGFQQDLQLDGALSQPLIEDPDTYVPQSLFAFLEQLPLATVVPIIAVGIIVVFFVTSSDSASYVVDTLTAPIEETADHTPARQRIFWAVSEGAVAGALLAAGGLTALEDVITTLGFPFFILGIVIMYCLIKGVRQDARELADEGRPLGPRPSGPAASTPLGRRIQWSTAARRRASNR